MIEINVNDPDVNPAYLRARLALPVVTLERPRQYFLRWQETYHCRVRGPLLIFDQDCDYTAFMLRWA